MPRAAVLQTNFAAGIMGPLLEARTDVEQHASGAAELTNVRVLPQGGVIRRPGTKYLAAIADAGRLSAFSFNRTDEYLLVWRELLLEIWSGGVKVLEITSPYTEAQAAEINTTQKHDTLIAFHQDVAPYRLFRASLPDDPVRTTSGSATVTVYHPLHGLIDGDNVGFSGVDTVAGVALSGNAYAITTHSGTLGANPLAMTSGSAVVTVTHAGHPFVTGDEVELDGISVKVRGIPAEELDRTHTVTVVDPNSYTVTTTTEAATTGGGGGTQVEWKAVDLYEVTASTTASSTTTGGGSSAKGWSFHSLDPARTEGLRLLELPLFDFRDEDSAEAADAQQTVEFTGTWAEGETFRLEVLSEDDYVNYPRGGRYGNRFEVEVRENNRTEVILYTATTANMATRMETALRNLAATSADGIIVEHLSGTKYVVRFTDRDGGLEWRTMEVRIENSALGTTNVVKIEDGGSFNEGVISATRGWPRTGAFYQQRLWLGGLKSRPSTLLGSQVDVYFNFATGDALDSDAIDVTGGFEPIYHIVVDRQMTLLTPGDEVAVFANEPALTPTNIGFRVDSTYGTSTVPPISVGGRPMFLDRTNRSLRQVSYALQSDAFEAPEVSLLAQHLFNTPVDMAVLRDSRGDYGFVVMTDGTMAVINVNHDHGIAAWTKWETSGSYLRVAEVGDSLYCLVQRTINGSSVRWLEVFDEDYLTDAGKQFNALVVLGQASASWPGFDHLNGETVQARGGWDTTATTTIPSNDYGDFLVSAGTITTDETADILEAGIGFSTTVKTLPLGLDYTSGSTLNKKARISRAVLDLVDSAGVYCGGWFVREFRNVGPDAFANPPALLTGVYLQRLRGWGRRPQLSITQTRPQPMTLRSMELEYNANARTT